jgi:hypothetical protein
MAATARLPPTTAFVEKVFGFLLLLGQAHCNKRAKKQQQQTNKQTKTTTNKQTNKQKTT